MRGSIRRIAFLLGGLFLTAIGLFTISLCEEDRIPYGALAGAVGGVLLVVAARRPSALPFTTTGGVLGGLVIALRQHGCAGELADFVFPLLLVGAVGVGVGLIHDSFRGTDRAKPETPPA